MYVNRKNLLDIYHVDGGNLGLYREPFDRVAMLQGFELRPVEGASEVWEFRNPASGERGRLLDVPGFLGDAPVSLTTRGRAYMITRQDFTLALLLPGAPRRIRLSETRHKVVPVGEPPPYPAHWPAGLITRVIRLRFRTVAILDEHFLLRQIGLRGSL